MYKKIADNRGEDKNKRINYRIIYLFLLLLLFTLPVTIPLPVGGKHIVVYIAELVIIFEWFIQALYFKFGFPQTDYFDRKYIGRIRIVSILLGIYIIVTRLFFLISGFDAEWLTYPRITLIFLISLFWIVRKRFESNDKITAVLLFITYLNILEIVFFIQSGSVRASKILLNINIYVCLFIVVLPTLVHLIINTTAVFRRAWYIGITISGLFLVMMSGSRAGTGIAIVVIAVELIFEKNNRGRIIALIFVVIPPALIIIGMKGFDTLGVLNRTFSIVSSSTVASDNVRSEIWKMGLQQFSRSPLFGTGILAFDFDFGYYKAHQSAHNFLIELLMSYGVIGTILYGKLVYLIFRFCTPRKPYIRLVLLTFASYLGFSLVEPTFTERIILFVFLLVITSKCGNKSERNMIIEDLKDDGVDNK